jgi:hypothetical protein
VFFDLFPPAFFPAVLYFYGKPPQIEKQIARIAAEAAPFVAESDELREFVLAFMTGFFDINISAVLSRGFLFSQNSSLLFFQGAPSYRSFSDCGGFRISTCFSSKRSIAEIDEADLLFELIVDDDTAGLLRDAFQGGDLAVALTHFEAGTRKDDFCDDFRDLCRV